MCPHTDALIHGNTCTHTYTCKTNGSGVVLKTILILNTLSGSTLLVIRKIIKLWSESNNKQAEFETERNQGAVRRNQDREKTVVNNVTSLELFWFGFVVVGSLGGRAIILLSGWLGTLHIVQVFHFAKCQSDSTWLPRPAWMSRRGSPLACSEGGQHSRGSLSYRGM